jgi:hypothetical protein
MEEIKTYCQIKNKNKVNDRIPVGVPIVWYPPGPLSPPLAAGGNICIFESGAAFMFTSNMFQENWKLREVRNNRHVIIRNKNSMS